MIYARFGYPRCLLPSLFIGLICVLLCRIFGTIGMCLCIPLLFFTYFADITAIRHNLKTGQAFSDSAKRVTSGLLPVIVFYLGNVIAVLFMSIVMDFIFSGFLSLLGEETLTSITTISETIMADPSAFSSNQTALLEMGAQLAAAPGLMQSLVFTAAAMALIFVPFFTAYKAYFFKALIAAQAVVAAAQATVKKTADDGSAEMKPDGKETAVSENDNSPFASLKKEIPQETLQNREKTTYDPHAGEDGEYDDKGRWFKYR